MLTVTNINFLFVVIMVAWNEEDIRLEENPNQGPPKNLNRIVKEVQPPRF